MDTSFSVSWRDASSPQLSRTKVKKHLSLLRLLIQHLLRFFNKLSLRKSRYSGSVRLSCVLCRQIQDQVNLENNRSTKHTMKLHSNKTLTAELVLFSPLYKQQSRRKTEVLPWSNRFLWAAPYGVTPVVWQQLQNKQTNKNSHCLIHVLPTTLLSSPPSFIHDYMKIMKWKKMHHAGEAAPGCPHSHHMPLDFGSSLWSGSVQPPQAGPHWWLVMMMRDPKPLWCIWQWWCLALNWIWKGQWFVSELDIKQSLHKWYSKYVHSH